MYMGTGLNGNEEEDEDGETMGHYDVNGGFYSDAIPHRVSLYNEVTEL